MRAGNTELAGTAQQVREQVDSAHRTQDILFALLGAHLSAPRESGLPAGPAGDTVATT
jgi:hypothetical protein